MSLEQFDPYFLFHSGFTRTKNEQRVATFSNPPAAIIRVLDPHSPMPDDQRSYLRGLGVKTVLIIPLTSRGQANGRLAISNAVRHAKPTVVSVTLRWEPPNLILKVKDNGSGISSASLAKSEGFGLRNMRTRASQIGGKLDIQSASGHETTIVLTVSIPS